MVQAAMEREQPLPDWYTEHPELESGEEFYLDSFWELSTERPLTGYGCGSIPWSSIREFALTAGLDSVMIGRFARLMRQLDGAYLRWIASEQKRQKDSRS